MVSVGAVKGMAGTMDSRLAGLLASSPDPPNFGFIGFPCVLLTFIGFILVLLVLTMVLQ